MTQSQMMEEFFIECSTLKNQFEDDALLQSLLLRYGTSEIFNDIKSDLRKLGDRTVGEVLTLGKKAQAELPVHKADDIKVSEAWTKLAQVAVEEGLVSTAYERKHGAFSRVHQFARVYLFGSSSAIYTCPLAMSDGAAKILSLQGSEDLKQTAFKNLTSRDSKKAWTSGQWMTERTGGSDVSQTGTIAKKDKNGFRLYGTKWFTSAATSEMALTLARIEGSEDGSKGLSLFYVKLRDDKGKLQNIVVNRLKDKLGTRALPTAELTLDGTPATLIGTPGDGVKKISPLLNITRLWNAVIAVSYMRRGLVLAKDYATKRKAFGRFIGEHPLHTTTLASLEGEFQGGFHLAFHVASLLGKDEAGTASEKELTLLRLLTPLTKLYTAKQAIRVTSEVLECVGGSGYLENTGLPALLRDAQVLAIWEGTTNILSLDSLRVIQKESLETFFETVEKRLSEVSDSRLKPCAETVRAAIKKAGEFKTLSSDLLEPSGRSLAFLLAEIYAASLLLDHAQQTKDSRFTAGAVWWCTEKMKSPRWADADSISISRILAQP